MGEWVSITAIFSPKANRSPAHQRDLRRDARKGETELIRALGQGMLPDESWRAKRACGPATSHLFFPQHADPDDDRTLKALEGGKIIERIEFDRPARLEAARAICASCPVQVDCTAFAIRVGLSDKVAIIAGLTPNERKLIGAELRSEMNGGCQMTREVGWPKRRKVMRALRAEMSKVPVEPHTARWDEEAV